MYAVTPGSAPGILCFQCHCQDTTLGPAKITWLWSYLAIILFYDKHVSNTIRWANFNCCMLDASLYPQTCVKGFRVYYCIYPSKDPKADCEILVEVLHNKRLSFLLLALETTSFPQQPLFLWAALLFKFLRMFPNVEGFWEWRFDPYK